MFETNQILKVTVCSFGSNPISYNCKVRHYFALCTEMKRQGTSEESPEDFFQILCVELLDNSELITHMLVKEGTANWFDNELLESVSIE